MGRAWGRACQCRPYWADRRGAGRAGGRRPGRPPPRRGSGSARRPVGPNRFRPTSTSVRCPTTSRPSRIHDRRASCSRSAVDAATAAVSSRPSPGGSRTMNSTPARRASAARRSRRLARLGGRFGGWPFRGPFRGGFGVRRPARASSGRSMTRTSTDRPARSDPAIAMPSSGDVGSGRRATPAGLPGPPPRPDPGSGQGPPRRQSSRRPGPLATSCRARVVRPLEGSPHSATAASRGTPPGPRIASRAAKPVPITRSVSTGRGRAPGRAPGSPLAGDSAHDSGAMASEPITRGAAAPQRVRRDARAAETSGERLAMGNGSSNKCSVLSRYNGGSREPRGRGSWPRFVDRKPDSRRISTGVVLGRNSGRSRAIPDPLVRGTTHARTRWCKLVNPPGIRLTRRTITPINICQILSWPGPAGWGCWAGRRRAGCGRRGGHGGWQRGGGRPAGRGWGRGRGGGGRGPAGPAAGRRGRRRRLRAAGGRRRAGCGPPRGPGAGCGQPTPSGRGPAGWGAASAPCRLGAGCWPGPLRGY